MKDACKNFFNKRIQPLTFTSRDLISRYEFFDCFSVIFSLQSFGKLYPSLYCARHLEFCFIDLGCFLPKSKGWKQGHWHGKKCVKNKTTLVGNNRIEMK